MTDLIPVKWADFIYAVGSVTLMLLGIGLIFVMAIAMASFYEHVAETKRLANDVREVLKTIRKR